MAKKLVTSPNAANDIADILRNVASFTGHWTSAVTLYEEIQAKFDLIAFMPSIGKKRNDGTQETFCRGYRIIYEIQGEVIYIIAVIHSRRLYPRT